MRSSALILVATLLACYAGPHLSPDETYASAYDAVEAGDAKASVVLLRRAAAAGHVWALADLAEGLTRGYLIQRDGSGGPATHLSIYGWPGEADLRARQLASAVRRGVASGDTTAILFAASSLAAGDHRGERWREPTAAERDSARALLLPLAQSGHPQAMLTLAFLEGTRSPEALAWFDRAAAAGNAQACWIGTWAGTPRGTTYTAATLADRLDRGRACAALPDGVNEWAKLTTETVGALRTQATAGNADAAAVLDSLRSLGVFRRHPDLAGA